MATAKQWVEGSRPRTLGAAIAPIAVGTGVAATLDSLIPARALLALLVMVAAQMGVNYANDFSDGVRGTDADRAGPIRLVGQRLARPRTVASVAVACLAVAAASGLLLVALTGEWWLLAIGAAALLAAWLYTGGPAPYGYLGLGELSVFIFFGLVPVVGTTYVQSLSVPPATWVAGAGVGALACAILVANNLRDIPTDAPAGKRTLAVRLGERMTRALYLGLVVSAFVVVPILALAVGFDLRFAWLAVLSAPLAVPPLRAVVRGASGRELVTVLQRTGLLLLVYGLLLGLGLGLS
jgi:1,4-dihydroxy-2-naphthoate polyprenyltransferase